MNRKQHTICTNNNKYKNGYSKNINEIITFIACILHPNKTIKE